MQFNFIITFKIIPKPGGYPEILSTRKQRKTDDNCRFPDGRNKLLRTHTVWTNHLGQLTQRKITKELPNTSYIQFLSGNN